MAMESVGGLELPDSRWVDVDGPVHYRTWAGPKDGPTFVCVHGLGGSHLNWALVAPGLARRGTVVALDLSGFGLTPPGHRGTGLTANWRLLDGFMRALDLGPAILVGNSMGGMLSLIQAAHHPSTVDRLILVDAAFPRARAFRGQPHPRVSAAFVMYANRRTGDWIAALRARRLGPEGLVNATLQLVAADPSSIDPRVSAAMVELVRTRMDFDYATRAFTSAAGAIFRAQARPGRYRELVRSVARPALVIHGGRDRLVPLAAAEEAVARHANWRLEVFADLGHVPQLEAPARWLQSVDDWLDASDAEGEEQAS
jgi:pimeloyl-ACP methyl ester carboxylesterase